MDYGLRYDYQTYLKEQYGRMPIASFTTTNPTVEACPGATIYGATCNCDFSHNYPWAFGPRVGVAYQINTKTVLRAGAGITYGVVQTPQWPSIQPGRLLYLQRHRLRDPSSPECFRTTIRSPM